MPALFTLPKQIPLSSGGLLLPGAKLYFYATGTSNPQNTYSDVLLATPNANPVIADASGVFAPIYLDPSLPHYRVKLTTSADVQIYQVDNVPSNQNTAQTFRLKATAPELILEETDASANNGKWSIRVNAEVLTIDLLNDAESVRTTVLTLPRTGIANFTSSFLTIGGLSVPGVSFEDFTATLTGMTGTVTGTISAARIGVASICKLSAFAAITGTSNTTAMTLTGIPSTYRPVGNTVAFATMTDNGVTKGGWATISSAGVITFGIGIDGSTAFTNSGTKGIPAKWQIVYVGQ